MSPDTSTKTSRRSLLAAAIGAAAASVAGAVGRPIPVRAGEDGDLVLAKENRAARTSLLNDDATSPSPGFLGWTYGTGPGVEARSLKGAGLRAEGHGPASPGIFAASAANATGVIGASLGPSDPEPASEPATGVYGYAVDGTGVRGTTTTAAGIGGRFTAPAGGTGLSVDGKARFSRSGLATVAKGKSSVDVAVPGGLEATSLVLATLQADRPGVAVSSVRINTPTAGKIRISLTRVASTRASTLVAWFVVG